MPLPAIPPGHRGWSAVTLRAITGEQDSSSKQAAVPEGNSSSGSARCRHLRRSRPAFFTHRAWPRDTCLSKSFLRPCVGGGRQMSLQAVLNLCSLHSEALLLPPSPCGPEGKSSRRRWSHARYEQSVWSRSPLYRPPRLLGRYG